MAEQQQPEQVIALDVPEVARRLNVHPDTVYALIQAGRLPAKKLGKQRGIRVSVRALEAFLEAPDNQ